MGLFDSIASNVLGSVLGGNQQGGGSSMLTSLLGSMLNGKSEEHASMIGNLVNSAGGITGLLQKAQQMGLGDVVSSWIGKGENQPITPEQTTQLVGHDAVSQLASKFGLDASTVAPLLASVLPSVVDKLTPNGEANDQEHSGEGLQSAVSAMLASNGGLGGLLSNIMGGGKPA